MMDGKNLGENVEKMVKKFVGNCFGELGHGGAWWGRVGLFVGTCWG